MRCRRHNIVLLLVAAVLLMMTLSRKHLLSTTFWSRDNTGTVRKDGLKTEMTHDATNKITGTRDSGNTDRNQRVKKHTRDGDNNALTDEPNDRKTSITLGRRVHTHNGFWKRPTNDMNISSMKVPERDGFGNTSNTCNEKTNLVFLKTHKTASSTVQNVIMRFGSTRNLTFALPIRGHIMGWPRLFRKSYVLQENLAKKNTTYNILCHHMLFHHEHIRELMPDDTVYITIIRDPVYMFESIFTYMRFDKQFRINTSEPLKTFLEQPFHFAKSGKRNPQRYRNPMLYEFGNMRTESDSDESIEFDIDRIEKIFSVVMIADYFEESLVLLKHTLCWDINDVTFFKINARKNESIRSMTADMAEKIRQWNRSDVMLFDHFNKTLWSKLSKLPFDWRKEVEVLKAKNLQLQDECLQSDSASKAKTNDKRFGVYQPKGIQMQHFQLKENALMNATCVNMAKSEKPFTFELQDREKRRISNQL
ncbi:galactose-3-O-sulfotransferase 2-like [Branchiostoma floridae]|uniref:Galactose-3-O-sulfotransferase 2-like n=1 Tax=Branchiostoma floridae TaxID=7739 RepID=A0A9J7LEM0_BRAFL|nr:galactose-3-O-sulfotransferase 2-like [Branchiostoma floridae]